MTDTSDTYDTLMMGAVIGVILMLILGVAIEIADGNPEYKEGYCAALGATSQDNLCLFENGTYKEIPND